MNASLATATFKDTWAGAVPAHVIAFKTTRNGARVTRYRWQRVDGMHCCGSTFTTVAAAVAAKLRDARFADVQG